MRTAAIALAFLFASPALAHEPLSADSTCALLGSTDAAVRESVLKTVEEAHVEACQAGAFALAKNPRAEERQRERAFAAALAAGDARGAATVDEAVRLLSTTRLPEELGQRMARALVRFMAEMPEPLPESDRDHQEITSLAGRLSKGEAVPTVFWAKGAVEDSRKALAGGRLFVRASGPVAKVVSTQSTANITLVFLRQGKGWVLVGPVKHDLR